LRCSRTARRRSSSLLTHSLSRRSGISWGCISIHRTTLFAALDIANGRVLTECKKRHRHQEFLSFLRLIDKNVPAELDIYVILDNYATPKHAKVKAWLADHPRFHLHFTPTYSSWLNQVERWFALVTERAIRRGSFSSVKELVAKIDCFVAAWNSNAVPFAWHATADSIFAKLARLCERMPGTGH
jgi:putative transposase